MFLCRRREEVVVALDKVAWECVVCDVCEQDGADVFLLRLAFRNAFEERGVELCSG